MNDQLQSAQDPSEKGEVPGLVPQATPQGRLVTRRNVLKHASAGIAAGFFSAAMGKSAHAESRGASRAEEGSSGPQQPSGKTPISLIIDDGSPVDAMFYMHPGYGPFLPPVEFYQRVADTLDRFEVRGKMTVLPMPSCLGRIDQSLKLVPQPHLQSYLKIVRERIAPRFDLTPEFLTHLNAFDLKAGSAELAGWGGYQHIYEDVWISGAPLEEVVQYFELAFTILKNVGLDPTGLTSPWMAGIDVEDKYAQALSEAQWKTCGRNFSWYFLHTSEWGAPQPCSVTYQSPGRDRVVVSVPANLPDLFWSMDLPVSQRQKFISDNIDRAVSPDGRSGRLRQLIDGGYPVTLLTHWQSLFTQGTELGLHGLNTLMERIQKEFGNSVEWITCSERARRFVASTKAGA